MSLSLPLQGQLPDIVQSEKHFLQLRFHKHDSPLLCTRQLLEMSDVYTHGRLVQTNQLLPLLPFECLLAHFLFLFQHLSFAFRIQFFYRSMLPELGPIAPDRLRFVVLLAPIGLDLLGSQLVYFLRLPDHFDIELSLRHIQLVSHSMPQLQIGIGQVLLDKALLGFCTATVQFEIQPAFAPVLYGQDLILLLLVLVEFVLPQFQALLLNQFLVLGARSFFSANPL